MITAEMHQQPSMGSTIHEREAAPARAPATGYWDIEDLCERLRKSRRTIFRWIKDGEFPKPRMSPGRGNRWAIEDVLAWESQQAKQDPH